MLLLDEELEDGELPLDEEELEDGELPLLEDFDDLLSLLGACVGSWVGADSDPLLLLLLLPSSLGA